MEWIQVWAIVVANILLIAGNVAIVFSLISRLGKEGREFRKSLKEAK
jgi:hypothetical protein